MYSTDIIGMDVVAASAEVPRSAKKLSRSPQPLLFQCNFEVLYGGYLITLLYLVVGSIPTWPLSTGLKSRMPIPRRPDLAQQAVSMLQTLGTLSVRRPTLTSVVAASVPRTAPRLSGHHVSSSEPKQA